MDERDETIHSILAAGAACDATLEVHTISRNASPFLALCRLENDKPVNEQWHLECY